MASVSPGALAHTHVGLTKDTEYWYRLRSANSAGASAWTLPVSSKTYVTNDLAPPTVPGGVSAIAVSPSSIDVTWAASTDEATVVANYRILQNTIEVATVPAAQLGYSANLLGSTAKYCFAVAAVDAVGNRSAASAPDVCATTFAVAATESAPSQADAGAVSATEIAVTGETTRTTSSASGSSARPTKAGPTRHSPGPTAALPFPLLMLSDIRASYWDGTFWQSIGGTGSGSVLTTGSVTSNSVSAFNSNFTIGSISFVLPLRIISFTASRVGGSTRINYKIGNELNVSHYELERSDDRMNFFIIHTQSAINRNGTEFYQYTDNIPPKGITYYRLKITEYSGRVAYSLIVAVAKHSKELYVIKNPVNESIDLYAGTSAKGIYMYSITATNGQVMQTGTINIGQPGVHSIRLQKAFAAGPYELVMKSNTVSLQKLIIKK